jgi:nicotinamide-nucleotide amidase
VTAESCTGGWLGRSLVDVPGSSAVYLGGWIAYANEMKQRWLHVDGGLLASHGAVSAEAAAVMVAEALACSGADHGLSVTGVAGPEGGSVAKPVGTVFIGLGAADGEVTVRRFRFPGDRQMVRDRTVKWALQMLRLHLMGMPADTPLLGEVAPSGEPVP